MAEKRESGIKWRSGGIAMVLILIEIIKNYKCYPYEKEQQKGRHVTFERIIIPAAQIDSALFSKASTSAEC